MTETLRTFLTHLLVPLVFSFLVWRNRVPSRLLVWAESLALAGYATHIFFAGDWSRLSYYLRYLVVIVAVAAVVARVRRFLGAVRGSSDEPGPDRSGTVGLPRRRTRLRALLLALPVLIFLSSLGSILSGMRPEGEGVDLRVPFASGTFVVVEGGRSPWMNSSAGSPDGRYEIQIAKMDSFGRRLHGLGGGDPAEAYHVFGDSVLCPCDGQFVSVTEGRVEIRCQDRRVLLSKIDGLHRKAAPGDSVRAGELLGTVQLEGPWEPRLRCTALDDSGRSVPIYFEGTYVVRNAILVGR